ncbi:hypothetical protein KIPB_012979, partial [Kipferlia bialata]|eukprot:g12979.t1
MPGVASDPSDAYQCPCGCCCATWETYVGHAVACQKVYLDTRVRAMSRPVLTHPALRDIPYCEDSPPEYLPGPDPFHKAVFAALERVWFRPRIFGSYGTVYATPDSDMDICLRECDNLNVAADVLRGCREVGWMKQIGKGEKRHLKVFKAGGKGSACPHVDVVLKWDNRGLHKRQ